MVHHYPVFPPPGTSQTCSLCIDEYCSKDDAIRLVRKLIIEGVLVEETQRQENQYATVVSRLKVNQALAGQMAAGALMISLPFAVKATADSRKAGRATKKRVSL